MNKLFRDFALITALAASPALADDGMEHDDSINPIILNTMAFEGIILGQPREEIIAMVAESQISMDDYIQAGESGMPIVTESVLEADIPVAAIRYTLPYSENGEPPREVVENFDRFDAFLNRDDPTWGAAQAEFQKAHLEYQMRPCLEQEIRWYEISIMPPEEAEEYGEVGVTIGDLCPEPVS